ncbi:M15 family metallopeptidase [Pseudarthrobacter albicanus]|uniref:M15 family metallopeptidase n=1 Tax=Pseudarthrobacter albicanus TaxID=2823873 RepID=UPI001BA7DDA3|nr:M15 family metallopeptidase [Pseudarthrobacter albicanus]
MRHERGGDVEAEQGPRPEAPSRRAFSRLLMAGSGLALGVVPLAGCSPEPGGLPSPAAGTPPPSAGTVPPSPAAPAEGTTPPSEGTTPAPVPVTPPGSAPSAAAPGVQHSLSDPASPWVVVNKHRPLSPADYVPADLVRPAVRLAVSGEAALLNSTTAAAAERLFAAAAADGVVLTLASGYRSFATQTATYGGYVKTRGQADADTASARPGYSEHQTGWAFDIGDGGGACSFQPCFAEQPAAPWARDNARRFGFVVRYPPTFEGITGYYYEPWHLRYIGVEAATDMANRGIATLEEYFGLEAAPGYL